MYVKPTRSYYTSDGEQHSARGLFLILIQPASWERRNEPIKALIRKVALRQFGHFMMGTARVYGESICISGAYGGNGLTVDVPDSVYNRASVVLPDDLREQWNKGGGWNSSGSEAPAMREWALKNIIALRQ
ncbi:MAG: hypothetical protein NUV65_06850 [Candidatus Roizmanbacteria bacterium]|nr:hypothetical protein [Candidatus Roizmanbacteria bacterium]